MNATTQIARDQIRSIVERGLTVADLVAIYADAEVWLPIDGFDGYEVSSKGRVKSRFKVLKPSLVVGYPTVCLRRNNQSLTRRLHILVANAFLGPAPFDGALVAHNDGVPGNCVINNLRWASSVENQADRGRHMTQCYGSSVHGAKLTESDIPVIRGRIRLGEKYQSIADDFAVHKSTIHLIAKGKIWKQVTGAGWSVPRNTQQARIST